MIRISTLWRIAAVTVVLLSATSAAARQGDEIDEIVVSADFRERSVSELPASVTVLAEEAIESLAIQHFEELVNVVPNLNWSGDGHRARYFQIRGVGELEQYQGAPNPSVGFLIDDIDFSGIGTVATLFDMGQVEVLRGPQGTRYGANALGGLIYMQSAAPTTEFESRAQLTLGGDDTLAAGFAAGGALSDDDRVAGRLSVHRHESDGFRRNAYLDRDDTNGREETTVRGRLRWQVSDAWQVDLATVFADVDNGYDAFALDNGYTMLSDKPGKDAQKSSGASLRVEHTGLASATLTSITSVADSAIEFSFDADWGNADSWAPVTYDYTTLSDRKRRTLSQEIRLATERWLLGVYAMRLEDELQTLNQGEYYDPFFDFADSLFDPLDSDYEASSVAAFGQYDFELGASSRISVGLRVERRSANYRDTAGLDISPAESMLGGEVSFSQDHSEAVSSYVSLSKGYKAGGFNLGVVPPGFREFDDEELWNLEGGIRALFRDGRVRVNAAIFANRRIDQQVRVSFQAIPGDPASFVFLTINADRGDTLGLEAEVNWYPTDSLSLYASLGLLDATFEEFDEAPGLVGRAQAHGPDYTLSFGGSYRHASGLFGRIDVSARDDFYFDVSHGQKSAAYELVNARLGYDADTWTAQLWARNLFDKDYAVRGFYFGNEPPDFPDTLYTRLGDPRQVGVTIEKRF